MQKIMSIKIILATSLIFLIPQCVSLGSNSQNECDPTYYNDYPCQSPYNHNYRTDRNYWNQYNQRNHMNSFRTNQAPRQHNPLYVPKARYNNFSRPGKWRL